MQGVKLLKGKAHENLSINISSYPKGIYYLKLTEGGLQTLKKLVLQ